jgi:hypothetical protein
VKKKAVSFSMTQEQINRVELRMSEHGILNRTEYLLLLHEADVALQFQPTFNADWQKILRPRRAGGAGADTYSESGDEAFPLVAEDAPPRNPGVPHQSPALPAKLPGPKVAPRGPALSRDQIAASKAEVERRLGKGKAAPA